jgi:hypothetical protein
MVSTDFNGEPILMLSLEHARQLKTIFDYFNVSDDENFHPLVEKVENFLDEAES